MSEFGNLRVDVSPAGQSIPDNAEVWIDFADGKKRVHPAVVLHLGGAGDLIKRGNKGDFKPYTYNEFLDKFWRLVKDDKCWGVFQTVIQNHLQGFRF